MADKIFNSPEEQEISEPLFYEGLGLTNINIEPHFVYDTLNFDDNEKYQRDALWKNRSIDLFMVNLMEVIFL